MDEWWSQPDSFQNPRLKWQPRSKDKAGWISAPSVLFLFFQGLWGGLSIGGREALTLTHLFPTPRLNTHCYLISMINSSSGHHIKHAMYGQCQVRELFYLAELPWIYPKSSHNKCSLIQPFHSFPLLFTEKYTLAQMCINKEICLWWSALNGPHSYRKSSIIPKEKKNLIGWGE